MANHSTSYEKTVVAFQWQVRTRLFAKHALAWSSAWGFTWGVTMVILRYTLATPPLALLWGFLGFIPTIAVASVVAIRQCPSRTTACAVLDQYHRAGGLLMAGQQMALGPWQDTIATVTVPRVHWRKTQSVILALGATLFVATCFSLPDWMVTVGTVTPLNIDQDVDNLENQIATLAQELIIEPPQAQELSEQLDTVQQQASGADPVKTWQALDHLRSQINHMAQETAQEAIQNTEQRASVQTLAQTLAQDGKILSDQVLSEAMAELAEQLEQALDENQQLIYDLPPSLWKTLEQGQLNPQQLSQLSEALQELNEETRQQLGRLVDAQLIDAQTLAQCQYADQIDSDKLAQLLANLGDKLSISEIVQLSRTPSLGGIDRGPGAAPLTALRTTIESENPLQAQPLPPATRQALRNSRLQGISAAPSQVDAAAIGSQGGALNTVVAGSGSAATHQLLPRHRGTIRRFFDRHQDPNTP